METLLLNTGECKSAALSILKELHKNPHKRGKNGTKEGG